MPSTHWLYIRDCAFKCSKESREENKSFSWEHLRKDVMIATTILVFMVSERKCLSLKMHSYHIVQRSTPIILTQHQPHCFPRAVNETSPLTEVSCANKQKGFPPVEKTQKASTQYQQEEVKAFIL